MKEKDLINFLQAFKEEKITLDEALNKLKSLPFDDLGYAKIDNHRGIRVGYPEVIYSEGKTIEQILGIIEKMQGNEEKTILLTRLSEEKADHINEKIKNFSYDKISRIGFINKEDQDLKGNIVIATGGTSDIAVAEEAALTAEVFGNKVDRIYDVGVAGIHRLLSNYDRLRKAKVVVAVAGMDGALPSALAGLVDVPVIAVPTSVGYGASFGGLAALLTMLNSCASGVSVVNIDNGFGAGYLASMINLKEEK